MLHICTGWHWKNAEAGARFHGVADEEIAFKAIAESIGKNLGIPVVSVPFEEAGAHFGWFTGFAGIDCPASSKITQEHLDWHPVQPTLLADMANGIYFK